MNDLESLNIYKQYVELIYYTETITQKYPKIERFTLVSQIKMATYNGIRHIIEAQKHYDKTLRMKDLTELDVELKMLKVLVRLSHKKKYINTKNYMAWSKKITNIGNLLGGWINSCLKR